MTRRPIQRITPEREIRLGAPIPRCSGCGSSRVLMAADAEHRPADTPPNARAGPVWRCFACGTRMYGPP